MKPQTPRNPDPPIFTYETAAQYLGGTPRQVQDAVRRRRISHVKVGQNVRFRRSDLDDYLTRNTVQADG